MITGVLAGLGLTLFTATKRTQNAMLKGVPKDRHLVLFFDVNDTMFIGDSAKGEDKNLAILKMLAENFVDVWEPAISSKKMSFRDFVETHLVPEDQQNPDIKEERHDNYRGFLEFLKDREHPKYEEIKGQFLKIQQNLKKGNIPASFINLVNYLKNNSIKYTIVFRTFGEDIKDLEEELTRRASLKNLVHAKFVDAGLQLNSGRILTTRSSLLETIKPFQHQAWQDNFKIWQESGESYQGAKPYPFNESHPTIDTIFFDDKVDKKILRVELHDDKEMNQLYPQKSLQWLLARKGFLVPVNTYDVCVDNNYFIDRVEKLYAHRTDMPVMKQEESNSSVRTISVS